MKRHSSKILALGVVCLAFLFMLSSIFGCKLATIGQSEPEFKTIKLQYNGEYYPFKIPGFMPDFTQFTDNPQVNFYSYGILATLTYNIPDSPLDAQGLPDQYYFLVSNIPSDMPVVLGLGSFIGNESRHWIYEKDIPVEVTAEEAVAWIETWVEDQMSGSFEEEEKKDKVI